MEVSRIVAEIDAQISKLQQAKALLQGTTAPKAGPGRPRKIASAAPAAKPVVVRKKRNLSADARKRIAEAQKKRWAERRKTE